ncbi:hypothetical protein EJ02DRAFT_215288 [Clathrospora elynae]|uniref:Uncharacterized protein n=1 Tax=Clathrospora elynae TaxID=706981 RepID=A0A6A5T205_9PLEO|nr:hypothetical protein EJ02DRAFT_215288 [Clathrospora elynae]
MQISSPRTFRISASHTNPSTFWTELKFGQVNTAGCATQSPRTNTTTEPTRSAIPNHRIVRSNSSQTPPPPPWSSCFQQSCAPPSRPTLLDQSPLPSREKS